MEKLEIYIDKPELYDATLADSRPENGDLKIITKNGAMQSGAAAVMVSFTVQLPDGSLGKVQSVTSMRLFRAMVSGISAAYDADGMPVQRNGSDDVLDSSEVH